MLDLNDLRVFERVAKLRSFSAAALVLGITKSSVSRSIVRLEAELGTRLLQRTTRETMPTAAGVELQAQCAEIMHRVAAAVDHVGQLTAIPRGMLRIGAGVAVGPNILADLLPEFLLRYPEISVQVDLSSRVEDLVSENIDVAIRIGPLTESTLVATRLGEIQAYLCASPSYLARRGTPVSPHQLVEHDLIAMPSGTGRMRTWTLRRGSETVRIELESKLTINCAASIHRLVLNGAGISAVAGYMSGSAFEAGTLVHLLPGWMPPPVDVHVVFPSRRELSLSVRAFVDFLKSRSRPGLGWRDDPLRD